MKTAILLMCLTAYLAAEVRGMNITLGAAAATPESIISVMEGSGIYLTAVKAAKLNGTLAGYNGTMFVPSDEAFLKALSIMNVTLDEALEHVDAVAALLVYQLVPGTAANLTDGTLLQSALLNKTLEITDMNGTMIVTGDYNSAEVLATRYVYDNYTGEALTAIHLIDSVLLPDLPSEEASDIASVATDLLDHMNITGASTNLTLGGNSSLALALALSNRTISGNFTFGNFSLGNLTLGNFSLGGNLSIPAVLAPVNSSLWKDPGYIMALAEGKGESYLRSVSDPLSSTTEQPSVGASGSGGSSSGSSSSGVTASLGGVIGVVAGALLATAVIIGAGIAVARRQSGGALSRTSSRLISALTGRPYARVGGYDGGMDVELPPNAFRGDSSTNNLV